MPQTLQWSPADGRKDTEVRASAREAGKGAPRQSRLARSAVATCTVCPSRYFWAGHSRACPAPSAVVGAVRPPDASEHLANDKESRAEPENERSVRPRLSTRGRRCAARKWPTSAWRAPTRHATSLQGRDALLVDAGPACPCAPHHVRRARRGRFERGATSLRSSPNTSSPRRP